MSCQYHISQRSQTILTDSTGINAPDIDKERPFKAPNVISNFSGRLGFDRQKTYLQRMAQNRESVAVLAKLFKDNRYPTESEKEKLAQFNGFDYSTNDAITVFPDGRIVDREMTSLMREEMLKLERSILDASKRDMSQPDKNAHVKIPPYVSSSIWNFISENNIPCDKTVVINGGMGEFFFDIPDESKKNIVTTTIVENNTMAGLVGEKLMPNLHHVNKQEDLPSDFYDVSVSVVKSNKPNEIYKEIETGFEKTKPGGLTYILVPKHFMSNISAWKAIYKEHGNLLSAIELPDNDMTEDKNRYTLMAFRKYDDDYKPQETVPSWTYRIQPLIDQIDPNSSFEDAYQKINESFGKIEKQNLPAYYQRCEFCGAYKSMNYACRNPRCSSNKTNKTNNIPGKVLLRKDGSFFAQDENCNYNEVVLNPADAKRLKAMVEMRMIMELMARYEIEGKDYSKYQEVLNKRYDAFVAEYGIVNSDKNRALFGNDPTFLFFSGIEKSVDTLKNTAEKNFWLTRDIIKDSSRSIKDEPISIEKALEVCIAELGYIDGGRISQLMNIDDVFGVISELLEKKEIFDVGNGKLEDKYEYLCGNVREKYRNAKKMAKIDPRYQANVDALAEVLPEDVDLADVDFDLGTEWIPQNVVNEFVNRTLMGNFNVVFVKEKNRWEIQASSPREWNEVKDSFVNTSEYGTDYLDGFSILKKTLSGKQITIYEDNNDKKVDAEKTLEVRELQRKWKNAFKEFVFDDEKIKSGLETIYNEKFNSEIYPSDLDEMTYAVSDIGSEMPDMYAHQKRVIRRGVRGDNLLLAHRVGAGKTFTMIGMSMDLKRQGKRDKPMHVVPNNLVEQYARDYLKMFPQANILVVSSEDMNPQNKDKTMLRIKNGDWDSVIISHNTFENIPTSSKTEIGILEEDIGELENALYSLPDDNTAATKRMRRLIEKDISKKEKKLAIAKDDYIREIRSGKLTWNELGVDGLFVDEADRYKNLGIESSMSTNGEIPGLNISPSNRAKDMFLKTRALQQKYGEGKGIVFATGTPVSNTVLSEAFNLQRMLDRDYLKKKGLLNFDSYVSNYGEMVQAVELTPAGDGYRTITRCSKIKNVPDLKNMLMRFSDIELDAKRLGLKLPKMKEDSVSVTQLPAPRQLEEYIKQLAERAENLVNVDPTEDNMLKITSDGKKAALDMRLVDPSAADDPDSKINAVVRDLSRTYHETTADKEPDGLPKTQLVFSDMGVPNNEGRFSVYDDIRKKLIQQGVKPEEIAFMQDYKDDDEKFRLYSSMNEGKVRILIGSTETMGAGTNVQRLLKKLYHLDSPWRPRDVEQREGRIIRAGNLNAEVEVVQYVTEGSFDVYSWQTLERKNGAVKQLFTNKIPERTIDDIDQAVLNYAQVKAAATGSSTIIEQNKVASEYSRLNALKTLFERRQNQNRAKKAALENEMRNLRRTIPVYGQQAMYLNQYVKDTGRTMDIVTNDNQTISLSDSRQTYEYLLSREMQLKRSSSNDMSIGKVYGFPAKLIKDENDPDRITMEIDLGNNVASLRTASSILGINTSLNIAKTSENGGFVTKDSPERTVNTIKRVFMDTGNVLVEAQTKLARMELKLKDFERVLGEGFAHEEEFLRLKARKDELDKEVQELSDVRKEQIISSDTDDSD